MGIEKLKLITRCGFCGQKSHWHKECTNPRKEKEKRFSILDRPVMLLMVGLELMRLVNMYSFIG